MWICFPKVKSFIPDQMLFAFLSTTGRCNRQLKLGRGINSKIKEIPLNVKEPSKILTSFFIFFASSSIVMATPPLKINGLIKIDTIGYRPEDPKYAVITAQPKGWVEVLKFPEGQRVLKIPVSAITDKGQDNSQPPLSWGPCMAGRFLLFNPQRALSNRGARSRRAVLISSFQTRPIKKPPFSALKSFLLPALRYC